MRSGLFLALLLICAWAAPRGARGGEDQGPHRAASVGYRESFYRFSDADHGEWGPGAQLRLPIDPAYAFEVSYDYSRYSSQGTNVRTRPIQATVIGYFTPDSGDSLYLLFGGGWYPTHADGPYNAPRLFGPHIGAGLELSLGGRWSLDGSYRYLWTEVFNVSQPRFIVGHHFGERGHQFTLGLNYRL